MNYADLGTWGPPVKITDAGFGSYYTYSNAAGDDWYQTVAHDLGRPRGLTLVLNADGKVIRVYDDVSHADPGNGRVIVITDPIAPSAEIIFEKRFDFAVSELVRYVSSEVINRERTRREMAGTTIDVTGYGSVPIQGRPEDKTNLQALALAASLRQQAGIEQVTTFRDAVNTDHELNNAQMIELYAKGTAWMENIYKASWAIKAMNPLPQDFDDDSHWVTPPSP